MADFTQHDQTTTKRIYALPSPTNWAEVGKVLAVIRQDKDLPPGEWDDTVTVEAWDEEIRFSFTIER